MESDVQNAAEWSDGFLFVGNQPALDLLNTRLVRNDEVVELLPDTGALVRWLSAAGVLSSSSVRNRVREWGSSRPMQAFLRDVLVFREDLRVSVKRFEAGRLPDPHFVAELNVKLRTFPRRDALAVERGIVHRKVLFEPANPDDLWGVLADAAATLFAEIPASRVRQCETCVVHFLDVSKKGSRRWCSMALCGNRSKVAAYQQRRRGAA